MIKTEINEIKKQFSDAHCTVSKICACYVSGEKQKITSMREAFLSLPEEDATRYFQILRKGLSGTLGKNLLTLEFPLEAEFSDGTQKFLLDLRDSHLEDDELLEKFYNKVIESYPYTQNYLILLVDCNYDVPGRTSDGLEMDDASTEVYHYLFCALCPVVQSKPGLTYEPQSNLFRNRICDWIVDVPMNAFLFPGFEDRTTNLHSALYFTKDTEKPHEDFVYSLLGCTLPIPAGYQKEAFHTIIAETLEDDCELEVLKEIHETLYEMMEEHEDELGPLVLDKEEVKNVLAKSGVKNEQLEYFDRHFDNAVGATGELVVTNIAETRKFEVKTPDVVIKVNPDRADLVETKVIDGRKYLMIEVGSNIQVNGVSLSPEKEE